MLRAVFVAVTMLLVVTGDSRICDCDGHEQTTRHLGGSLEDRRAFLGVSQQLVQKEKGSARERRLEED